MFATYEEFRTAYHASIRAFVLLPAATGTRESIAAASTLADMAESVPTEWVRQADDEIAESL